MPQDPSIMAIRAARSGWKVFPIKAGDKKPPLIQWSTGATNDIETIQSWVHQWPGCNWGVACGPSGLFVVDCDPKKNGVESLDWLLRKHGNIDDTLIVETPSGGMHFYFEGEGPTTADRLGTGIDTRGVGGYVVLPGGQREDGAYRLVKSVKPKSIPKWITKLMSMEQPERAENAGEAVTELDLLANIQRAARFLKDDAEPATEGDHGDLTTFQTACKVKDMGISERVCMNLMYDVYNERCQPPWELSDLQQKVKSAYRYGLQAIGSMAPEAVFANVPLPDSVRPLSKIASEIDVTKIQPRKWILEGRYIKGYSTVTIAPGGVGKSTLVLLEAVSIQTGRDLTGRHVLRRGNVWIISEDPQDDTERRIAALAQLHNVPLAELSGLHYTSFRDESFTFAAKGANTAGVLVNQNAIAKAIRHIRENKILMLVIDPFLQGHDVDENDNTAIQKVVHIYHRIAEQTGCAICIVHHTRKKGVNGAIGDMDTARGASSLVSAARVTHTLTPMSDEDAGELGIAPEDKPFFLRLDKAKANMTPPDEQTEWFRLRSVDTPWGESVGAIERYIFDASKIKSDQDHELCTQIIAHVGVGNQLGLSALASRIKSDPASNPSIRGMHRTSLVRKIQLMLATPVDHGAAVISVDYDEKPGKKRALYVKIETNQLLE